MAKTQASKPGGAMTDMAEGLGRFLGQAEAKWNSWRGEREEVVKTLTDIRDRATKLLEEVGDRVPSRNAKSKRGRPVGSKNTPAAAKGKSEGQEEGWSDTGGPRGNRRGAEGALGRHPRQAEEVNSRRN